MNLRLAAVDLGASSGRVMVGEVGPDVLELTEVHRFWNGPVAVAGTLYWDILHLYRETLIGLTKAGPVDGIGIDSWAVDYGLLDANGKLLGNPVHYRDTRTTGKPENVRQKISEADLYAITGLQHLPFNTVYQLAAEPLLAQAKTLLLIPDLLTYWLTGSIGAEATNASTTQLYDVHYRTWSDDLLARLGIPRSVLPPIHQPGELIAPLLPAIAAELTPPASAETPAPAESPATSAPEGELTPATPPVIAVGSHDTASSVVAVPAVDDRFAYISSGTWSLVGLELEEPVLTAEAREANFTNEGGVDGKIRFLKNVMGLWILQECLREWDADLERVLAEAAAAPAFAVLIDPDDPSFLAPGNMVRRITEYCGRGSTHIARSNCALCAGESGAGVSPDVAASAGDRRS